MEIDLQPVGHGHGCGLPNGAGVALDRFRIDDTAAVVDEGLDRDCQFFTPDEQVDIASGAHEPVGVIEGAERGPLQDALIDTGSTENLGDLDEAHVVPDPIPGEVDFESGHLAALVEAARQVLRSDGMHEQTLETVSSDERVVDRPVGQFRHLADLADSGNQDSACHLIEWDLPVGWFHRLVRSGSTIGVILPVRTCCSLERAPRCWTRRNDPPPASRKTRLEPVSRSVPSWSRGRRRRGEPDGRG